MAFVTIREAAEETMRMQTKTESVIIREAVEKTTWMQTRTESVIILVPEHAGDREEAEAAAEDKNITKPYGFSELRTEYW